MNSEDQKIMNMGVADTADSKPVMESSFKNVEEIRFYVRDLCFKIEELENIFEYVPASSYNLLAKYNRLQNSTTEKSFNTIL